MTFPRRLLALAGTVAVMALSACGGGSLPSEEGNLRLVNATTDFPSLDLFQTNGAFITGVAPLSASGFASLKNGNYAIDVRATGSGTALVTGSVSLAKKDFQTVVAYANAGSLALAVLSDKESDPSSGNAKVRVFNAASGDTGGLDVYLTTGACSTLVGSGSAPFAANLSGLQPPSRRSPPRRRRTTCASRRRATRPSCGSTSRRSRSPTSASSRSCSSRSAGGFLVNGHDDRPAGRRRADARRLGARARRGQPVAGRAGRRHGQRQAGRGRPDHAQRRRRTRSCPAGALTVKINGMAYTPATPITVAAGADATLLLTGTTPTVTLIDDDNTHLDERDAAGEAPPRQRPERRRPGRRRSPSTTR